MRHLKIYLEDDVFEGMKKLKEKAGLTWEHFIIKSVWEKFLAKPIKESDKNL